MAPTPMNVYPAQYQLAELTAHVVSLLERRRLAFEEWTQALEATLTTEAGAALAEAGRQFHEVADDPAYWARVEGQLLTVALPRYLRAARDQHALERRRYDVWRGGDVLSRASYAIGGLLVGVLVLRTALPDWLEPIPLAFFIGGPLLPDLQVWLAKRRYARQLAALVDEMRLEALDRGAYTPLGLEDHSPAEADPTRPSDQSKVR
jgi:hypothetical protein